MKIYGCRYCGKIYEYQYGYSADFCCVTHKEQFYKEKEENNRKEPIEVTKVYISQEEKEKTDKQWSDYWNRVDASNIERLKAKNKANREAKERMINFEKTKLPIIISILIIIVNYSIIFFREMPLKTIVIINGFLFAYLIMIIRVNKSK